MSFVYILYIFALAVLTCLYDMPMSCRASSLPKSFVLHAQGLQIFAYIHSIYSYYLSLADLHTHRRWLGSKPANEASFLDTLG